MIKLFIKKFEQLAEDLEFVRRIEDKNFFF